MTPFTERWLWLVYGVLMWMLGHRRGYGAGVTAGVIEGIRCYRSRTWAMLADHTRQRGIGP